MDDDLTPEEEDELRHYASEYYDPAKAREYYLRTRKLKGRKAGSGEKPLTGAQRDAWNYTQKKINTAEDKETKKNLTANQKKVEALQTRASATRDRIQDKIEKFFADQATNNQTETNKINEKREQDLQSKINPIPGNASPKRRAFLEKQNAQIRDSINKAANKELKDLKIKSRNSAIDTREATRRELTVIAPKLREALDKTRMDYEKQVTDTRAKYETIRTNELAGIKKNIKDKK